MFFCVESYSMSSEIETTLGAIEDLCNVFLSLLCKISPISFVVFDYVDKFWHNKITTYAIKCKDSIKMDRQLCCKNIASEGLLEVLKWARENNCAWDSVTCSSAALNGHLEVLQWAHQNGCEWGGWTCRNAAENAHLEVLKWARQNGCEWDSWTCARAALNGHLEVLKWARLNGCEWDSSTYSSAASNGHLEVLKWALENGCPGDDSTRQFIHREWPDMFSSIIKN